MSLLTAVQSAAAAVGTSIPTAIANNTDLDARQWLTFAKRELRELARRHDWQNLIVHHTWVTAATEAQPLALPADFDHFVPYVEIWNRTGSAILSGPITSGSWQHLQSGGITGGSTGWWRVIGNVLNIYPAPTAGLTYALEYVSKNACETSGGTDKETWTLDDDVARVPEHLIELGLTWRWLRSKGMDYAEEMATYERELEKASARDRGVRVMMVSQTSRDIIDPVWNGTITVP